MNGHKGERFREPVRRQGEVRLVTLFTTVTIEQAHFGSHIMIFDGLKFDKILHENHEHVLPSAEEILYFKRAVARAAREDGRIAALVKREPKLQLSPGEKESDP
jgi:hypothetical protein